MDDLLHKLRLGNVFLKKRGGVNPWRPLVFAAASPIGRPPCFPPPFFFLPLSLPPGTEANDLAILIARAFTRSSHLLALRSAYHGGGGAPYAVTAHSTWKHVGVGGGGGGDVVHIGTPDAYRGAFGADGAAYARDLEDAIATCTPGRVAGFIHETVQGVG